MASSQQRKNVKYSILRDPYLKLSNIIHTQQQKGLKALQEDSVCVVYSADLSVILASVFDGHGGVNGQVASRCCAKVVNAYFKQHWKKFKGWSRERWELEMKSLYEAMHDRVRKMFAAREKLKRKRRGQHMMNVVDEHGVVRDVSGMPIRGGTTASTVFMIRTPKNKWKIISANVGDSTAFLFGNQSRSTLSTDHKPGLRDEYLRIRELDSKKYPNKLLCVYAQDRNGPKHGFAKVFTPYGKRNENYVINHDKYLIYPSNARSELPTYAVSPAGVTHDATCIAITRAIGDFCGHKLGLTFVPTVSFQEREFHEKMTVIVASDGIWDCWGYEVLHDRVLSLLETTNSLSVITSRLIQATIARARTLFRNARDDASIVLVALHPLLYPPIDQVYDTSQLGTHPIPNRCGSLAFSDVSDGKEAGMPNPTD